MSKVPKCGNCLDGKLVMPGETCGACGYSEPVKPKPALNLTIITGVAGTMQLSKLASGKLWLTNGNGEGMEIKDGDKKFQACLRDYFNANF